MRRRRGADGWSAHPWRAVAGVLLALPTPALADLVDELNRLFAGQPVSGFVAPVHLVTPANIDAGAAQGGSRLVYDPVNDYRGAYRRIWKAH